MKVIFTSVTYLYLLFFLTGCHAQNKGDQSYEGFPLEVTEDYKKAELIHLMDVPYYNYYLKEPKVIQSYPIKGDFRVNPEGVLYGFTLSKTHPIKGTMIPGGSWYHRYEEDIYLITLSKDTIIQGYPAYHKEDGFIFWTENHAVFYTDGKLCGLGLSEDMVIKGIPCNASKNNRSVTFFKNGELRHCRLSENKEIQGYPCYGGDDNSELWFYSDGQVLSFVLSKDFFIDGKSYRKGTQIIFDTDGTVHYLSGHLDFLSFHGNNRVHNVVLKDDLVVEGISLTRDSRIIFNETGELNTIKPKQDALIEGIPCKKRKWVGFYPNGKIKSCTLSRDFEINGNTYKKGDWLNFDEDGNIQTAN